MDDYAGDVVALMDALGIETAVIGGLSMGGYVTFALFRQAPERFDGVILADTKAQADTAEGQAGRRAMSETLRGSGVSAVVDELLPKLLGETTHRERPQVLADARRLMEANQPDAIDAALHALMTRPDSTPDLPRISCPALVIVGQEDAVTPAADAELLALLDSQGGAGRAAARGPPVESRGAGRVLERAGEVSVARCLLT